MYEFSSHSLNHLKGVHPDLVAVVKKALTLSASDFAVIDGLRTLEEQKKYVETGRSQTMHSRHLTGHAVDIAPYVDGKISWKPDDYEPLADAMHEASQALDIEVQWGGDWQSFKDYPHFQLPWSSYPAEES